jgi:hypothetical protein
VYFVKNTLLAALFFPVFQLRSAVLAAPTMHHGIGGMIPASSAKGYFKYLTAISQMTIRAALNIKKGFA